MTKNNLDAFALKYQEDLARNSNYINKTLGMDIWDYINEDLDEGVEAVGDVLGQIKGTISNKRKKGFVDVNQKPMLVEELNMLLQKISKKDITEASALAEIKKELLLYPKPIKVFRIDVSSNLDSIDKIEKLKKEAIRNKDYEKAAYYRDLISELEIKNKFYNLALQHNMDAFFACWIEEVYYVVQKETSFNQDIIQLFED